MVLMRTQQLNKSFFNVTAKVAVMQVVLKVINSHLILI